MTRQEKLLHALASQTTLRVEEVLAIPSNQRARMYFALFQLVKRGLEALSLRSDGQRKLTPSNN